MIYRSLLQLKENQRTVEILLGEGYSSFKGKVIDVNPEYVLMSIITEDCPDNPSWYESIIKLSFVSSIIYKRELSEFLIEDRQKQYEREIE